MSIVNESESHLAEIHPALVLSLAIDSALERGVDAFSTGMTYNYSAVGEVGFATAVDSLLAVKAFVYCGALSPAVPAEGYFDILMDAHDLLRT